MDIINILLQKFGKTQQFADNMAVYTAMISDTEIPEHLFLLADTFFTREAHIREFFSSQKAKKIDQVKIELL